MVATSISLSNHQVRNARWAVSAIFLVFGIFTATVSLYIPFIQERFAWGEAELGRTLLIGAVASVFGTFSAGWVINQTNSKIVSAVGALLVCSVIPFTLLSPTPTILVLLLMMQAMSGGMTDVAMNTQGAIVERKHGGAIMSSLHGFYSVGTVVGAGIGWLVSRSELSLPQHMLIQTPFLWAIVLVAAFQLLPTKEANQQTKSGLVLKPIIIVLGLVTMVGIMAELVAFEWGPVYMRRSLQSDQSMISLGLAAVTVFMSVGRLSGDWLVERLNPMRMLLMSGLLIMVGMAVTVWGGDERFALVGFAITGLGVSNLVPLLLRAGGQVAGDTAVGTVMAIGYLSFLVNPVIMAVLSEVFSLRVAMTSAVVYGAIILLGSRLLRERTPSA
ncbi:MAG: MFS transporter [Phototrophicaceae bacterium]